MSAVSEPAKDEFYMYVGRLKRISALSFVKRSLYLQRNASHCL